MIPTLILEKIMSEVSPKMDIRHAVVPIPTEQIREFFTNKNLFFIINYENSKLKGAQFLTYLTNLSLPCDVVLGYDTPYEVYEEIMMAYFEQRAIVETPGLHVEACSILLYAKGYQFDQLPYVSRVPEETIRHFTLNHMDIIQKWTHFLDSMQVYGLYAVKALNDFYQPEERFEIIDDREYVGANIAALFSIPEFMGYYYALPDAAYRLSFFKPQFEEYMFKNNTLAHYFNVPTNFIAHVIQHFAMGTMKPEEFIGTNFFKIGVFNEHNPAYKPEPYEPGSV